MIEEIKAHWCLHVKLTPYVCSDSSFVLFLRPQSRAGACLFASLHWEQMASRLPLCAAIKSTACVKGQVKKQMSNRNRRHLIAANMCLLVRLKLCLCPALVSCILEMNVFRVDHSCPLSVLCAILESERSAEQITKVIQMKPTLHQRVFFMV